MSPDTATLKDVQTFWSTNPCDGKHEVLADLQRRHREKEPEHYKDIASISASPEDIVVEVGCGQGSDLSQIFERFPRTIGGDLTFVGLSGAVQMNPKLRGRVVEFNAEKLPFRSDSVGFVYSFGVIHHTPVIENAIREMHRILRPGGKGLIHIYHRNSPKGILVKLFRLFLRFRPIYEALVSLFPNRGTAVAELCLCPVLNLYTKRDVRHLFSAFTNIRFQPNHTGLIHMIYLLGFGPKSWLYRALLPVELALSSRLGFHLVFTFEKQR